MRQLSYVTQHIKRYQLLKDSILSYKCAKSKYLKMWSQGWFWDFTLFWNHQYFCKLLDGFDHDVDFPRTAFLCKIWLLNFFCMLTLCPLFPNFKSLFFQTFLNFSPICVMTSSMKLQITISKRCNVQFKFFNTKIELKRTAIFRKQQKSILNIWPNWSISMCWVTFSRLVLNGFIDIDYSVVSVFEPVWHQVSWRQS